MTGIARAAVIGLAYGVAIVVGGYCWIGGAVGHLRDKLKC
jgi:hypothetical protein